MTRPSDAEHVGYLVPHGADGSVVPTSLVGLPLGPARDRAAAETVLPVPVGDLLREQPPA